MTTQEKYTAAAYLVVLAVVLVYLLLYATKLARLDRELSELAERVKAQQPDG